MSKSSLKKMIHVACRDLGIDNDTRQQIQLRVTGKASMTDMQEVELKAVVDDLKARGFKLSKSKRHPTASRSDLRLVHVLWGLLSKAGVLSKPGRAGLNAFVRSQFESAWGSVPIDIDALRDPKKINAIVRALKAMCDRNGVAYRK